jgi:hypothetical protein
MARRGKREIDTTASDTAFEKRQDAFDKAIQAFANLGAQRSVLPLVSDDESTADGLSDLGLGLESKALEAAIELLDAEYRYGDALDAEDKVRIARPKSAPNGLLELET